MYKFIVMFNLAFEPPAPSGFQSINQSITHSCLPSLVDLTTQLRFKQHNTITGD